MTFDYDYDFFLSVLIKAVIRFSILWVSFIKC